MIRFPGVWRAAAALGQRRLSPRSRLRRAFIRRSVVSGWDAASRRDFKLMQVRYAPDVQIEYDPEFAALGLGGTFRGHDGQISMVDALNDAWEHWTLAATIVLDLGDRILVLGTVRLPGNMSGLTLDHAQAQLMTVRGGLVTHEQFFFGWDRGLRAAGLDPETISLPSPDSAYQA